MYSWNVQFTANNSSILKSLKSEGLNHSDLKEAFFLLLLGLGLWGTQTLPRLPYWRPLLISCSDGGLFEAKKMLHDPCAYVEKKGEPRQGKDDPHCC